MKKLLKKIAVLSGVLALALTLAVPVLANSPAAGEADPAAVSETQEDNTLGLKAIASGIAIGIAAGGGAVGLRAAHVHTAEHLLDDVGHHLFIKAH